MSDINIDRFLLLKRKEAAAYLGLSEAQFTKRVKEGVAPPPVVNGGCVRWRTEDIKAFKARPVPSLRHQRQFTHERRPKSVPLGPGTCHLYRHFDKGGRLLYVGISLSAVARLADHKKESAWFWQIARIEVTAYATRDSAMKAERISIKRERPLHNIVHAVREAA